MRDSKRLPSLIKELEQNIEELTIYEKAFYGLKSPIIIFDDKGNVLEKNSAADRLLYAAAIEENAEFLETEFLKTLKDTAIRISDETISSRQRYRIFCGDISYEAVLTPLLGTKEKDGIIAVLWCLEEEYSNIYNSDGVQNE